MGFISNPDDARLMAQRPELFARGIYDGTVAYFS
jgi:N-acetylmuramoyl-L-alanine amidase